MDSPFGFRQVSAPLCTLDNKGVDQMVLQFQLLPLGHPVSRGVLSTADKQGLLLGCCTPPSGLETDFPRSHPDRDVRIYVILLQAFIGACPPVGPGVEWYWA